MDFLGLPEARRSLLREAASSLDPAAEVRFLAARRSRRPDGSGDRKAGPGSTERDGRGVPGVLGRSAAVEQVCDELSAAMVYAHDAWVAAGERLERVEPIRAEAAAATERALLEALALHSGAAPDDARVVAALGPSHDLS